MAWYAYCITEQQGLQANPRSRRPFAIDSVRGVNDAPVLAYPSGEFAVIVSEYSHSKPLTQQAIMEHGRVVSECFRTRTVLPFRFGTIFDSDEALRRAVKANRKTFMESVDRLRGKAEMHLKVLVDDICPESKGADCHEYHAGQEYLSHLRESASRQRERQSRARALSLQMHRMFLPLAEEAVTACPGDLDILLMGATAALLDGSRSGRWSS